MAVRLSALCADRPLPPGRFLVLIYVRGWIDPRTIVRLEGLRQLKRQQPHGNAGPFNQQWIEEDVGASVRGPIPAFVWKETDKNHEILKWGQRVRGSIFENVTSRTKVKSATTWSNIFSCIAIPYLNQSCKIFTVVTASSNDLNTSQLPPSHPICCVFRTCLAPCNGPQVFPKGLQSSRGAFQSLLQQRFLRQVTRKWNETTLLYVVSYLVVYLNC
jgi:hypothetical protein